MKPILTALGLAGALSAIPALATATPVTIDIAITAPASLSATGGFDFDAATSTYSNFNVFLTGTLGPFTFVNEACDGCPLSGSSVGLIDPTFAVTSFLSDFEVTFRGGLIDTFFRGNSIVIDEFNGRVEGTYSLVAPAAVPEPSVWLLLAVGSSLAAARRRLLARA